MNISSVFQQYDMDSWFHQCKIKVNSIIYISVKVFLKSRMDIEFYQKNFIIYGYCYNFALVLLISWIKLVVFFMLNPLYTVNVNHNCSWDFFFLFFKVLLNFIFCFFKIIIVLKLTCELQKKKKVFFSLSFL